MKILFKILAFLLITNLGFSQQNSEETDATIDLNVFPNNARLVTALKVNNVFKVLNLNHGHLYYDETRTYKKDSAFVIQNGEGYVCIADVSIPETFNPVKWNRVTNITSYVGELDSIVNKSGKLWAYSDANGNMYLDSSLYVYGKALFDSTVTISQTLNVDSTITAEDINTETISISEASTHFFGASNGLGGTIGSSNNYYNPSSPTLDFYMDMNMPTQMGGVSVVVDSVKILVNLNSSYIDDLDIISLDTTGFGSTIATSSIGTKTGYFWHTITSTPFTAELYKRYYLLIDPVGSSPTDTKIYYGIVFYHTEK